MKRLWIIIISVCLIALFACDSAFTAEKWAISSESQRYRLIDDLQSKYTIVGMSSEEVLDLLGTPTKEVTINEYEFNTYIHDEDTTTDMFWYYRIKDDFIAGWEIFLIEFSDDIVVNTSTGVEDW